MIQSEGKDYDCRGIIMSYHVRLEQFEGPLELLLSLIEKEKLDVTKLSLATVADQYLEYIVREAVPLSHLAQFLSVASRLILLKSRALLPVLSFTEEEAEDIEDLEQRLREYRRFHDASIRLGKLFFLGYRSFHRELSVVTSEVFAPPKTLKITDIREAFFRVLSGIPLPMCLEERVMEDVMTIENRMASLRERISRSAEIAFSEVVAQSKDRFEVVVSFLALLELVRRKMFEVDQGELFGEIRFRATTIVK